MSSSPITEAVPMVPVVIWSEHSKIIRNCEVSIYTKFQDIIDALQLQGIRQAFVGNKRPFQLIPCDFDPDENYTGGPPTSNANIFTYHLVSIVGLKMHLDDPHGYSISQAVKNINYVYRNKQELTNFLTNFTVHLFTYDHKNIDCCDGLDGHWNARNPDLTTSQDTLWMRLEKEYYLNTRSFDRNLDKSNWAHAKLPATGGVSTLLRHLHAHAHRTTERSDYIHRDSPTNI